MKKNIYSKLFLLLFIALLIVVFVQNDFAQYLTLESIKANQDALNSYYQKNPLNTVIYFSIVYITVTALSLPGATILTLMAGVVFGNLIGLLIVSFTSTIGATIAFLVSRFLLQTWVEKKFSKQLNSINQGIEKEGAFYLFSLRLVPLFPFFMINLLMGLTRIKTFTFYWVSQIGMF